MSNVFASQKLQKAIQIFLIFVLLTSSLAFLPQTVQAKGSTGGTLSAHMNSRKVSISGQNFPKNHDYIVTAKSGKGSATKIGSVKSSASGSFTATLTLPTKFKLNTKATTVCVKDNRTSKRTCTTAK